MERFVLSPDNVRYGRLKLLFTISVKIDGQEEAVDIECAYVSFCYEIKLEPSEFRATYQEAVSAQIQELKSRCRQYKIDFIPVDVASDFQQVLLPFLMKRQSLY